MTINTIKLTGALPAVFAADTTARNSEVWLTHLELTRPGRWLIAAESGTGKTSLCSYLYGERTDYSGTITFDGTDIATLSPSQWCELRRTSLAWLPQEMHLFPELTVIDNIMLKNRLTDHHTEAEIHRMLERLEIDGKLSERAGRLSVGQQQRVAIVRALCQPFSFLIADEPVSHLDARNNAAAAALIEHEAAAQRAGVIVTSVGNHLMLSKPLIVNL